MIDAKIKRGKRIFKKGVKVIYFPLRLTEKFHQHISNEASKINVSKHKLIIDAIKERIGNEKTN